MSFRKFLETIKLPFIIKVDERRSAVLLNTNPNRIFLENVRSYYNTSTIIAKTLCKMAVKDGRFIKKVGIMCPNENCERIIISYDDPNHIDQQVTCDHCELIGNPENTFAAENLETIEFYQLAK